MFDIINIEEVTREVTKTVHEHRAPTDESIRILREMEQQIEAKVIGRLSLNNHQFKPTLLVYEEHLEQKWGVWWVFEVNGEKFQGKFYVSKWDKASNSEAILSIFQEIRENLSKQIASVLLESSMTFTSIRDASFKLNVCEHRHNV